MINDWIMYFIKIFYGIFLYIQIPTSIRRSSLRVLMLHVVFTDNSLQVVSALSHISLPQWRKTQQQNGWPSIKLIHKLKSGIAQC